MEVHPIQCSFTIIQDTREQKPWSFDHITKRVKAQDTPVLITVELAKLDSGDYSIKGFEDQIAIERKSAADLVSTIFYRRKQFMAELERLQQMQWSGIIVESEWSTTAKYCAAKTQASVNSLKSSVLSWQIKYPRTHWLWLPGKREASRTAWKVFELWMKSIATSRPKNS